MDDQLERSLERLTESNQRLMAAVDALTKSIPKPKPEAEGGHEEQEEPAARPPAGNAFQRWTQQFNQKIGYQLGSYARGQVQRYGAGEALNLGREAVRGPKGDGGTTGEFQHGFWDVDRQRPNRSPKDIQKEQTQELARKFADTMGEKGTGNAAGAGRAASPAAAGSGAGEAAAARGAASAAGGAEAGAVAGVGAAAAVFAVVAAVVIGLKKFHDAVVDAAKAQQQQNFKHAEFSSSMAVVKVQSDIADIFRSKRVGDATAGTAGELAKANTKYDDQMSRLEIIGNNLKNSLLAGLMDGFANVMEPIADGVEGLVQLVEEVSGYKLSAKPDPYLNAQNYLEDQRKLATAARLRGEEAMKALRKP